MWAHILRPMIDPNLEYIDLYPIQMMDESGQINSPNFDEASFGCYSFVFFFFFVKNYYKNVKEKTISQILGRSRLNIFLGCK